MQHKNLKEYGLEDLVRSKQAMQLVVNDWNEYRYFVFFTLCCTTVVENIC